LSRFSAYLFSLQERNNGPSLKHGKSSEKDAIVLTKRPAHFRSDILIIAESALWRQQNRHAVAPRAKFNAAVV